MTPFGDWLGVEKMRNTWYLFCITRSETFYDELRNRGGNIVHVTRIKDAVYQVDASGDRKGLERLVRELTEEGDTAVLVYPTYKGLKHKLIR
jgi:hypothetical protein